jgi:hypothetical protein
MYVESLGMGTPPGEGHAVALRAQASPGHVRTKQKQAPATWAIPVWLSERIRQTVQVKSVCMVFHFQQHLIRGHEVSDEDSLAGIPLVAVMKGVDYGFIQGQPDGEYVCAGIPKDPHPKRKCLGKGMQLDRGVHLDFPGVWFPTKVNRPRKHGMSFGARLHARTSSSHSPGGFDATSTGHSECV